MAFLKPEDFDKVCRLCMKSGSLVSIVEKYARGQKRTLSVLVRETVEMLGLSIHVDDMLPKKMCMECKNYLRSLYKFRNRCHESSDLLLESLSVFTAEKSTEWLEEEELLANGETDPDPETVEINAAPKSTTLSNTKIIDIQRADRVPTDEYNEYDADDGSKYDTRGNGDEEYVLYTDYEEVPLEEERVKKEVTEASSVQRVQQDSRNRYVCTVCNKTTTNMKYHMMSHTNERPHECETCHKKFRTNSKLRSHVNGVHLKLRQYVCKECGKGFLESSNLRNHMVTHGTSRNYVCQEKGCGKSFALSGTLNVHKKLHAEKNQFQCDVCLKFFRYKWALVKHIRIHTGEKPYPCAVCGRSFSTTTHLNTHMKMHDREHYKNYEVYTFKVT